MMNLIVISIGVALFCGIFLATSKNRKPKGTALKNSDEIRSAVDRMNLGDPKISKGLKVRTPSPSEPNEQKKDC